MKNKYYEYPKFIHNLWTKFNNKKEVYYLSFLNNYYEVDTEKANNFLKFRSFCTGNNTIDEVSIKSNIDKNIIKGMLKEFKEIGMIRENEKDINEYNKNQILEKIKDACNLWREQLDETNIFHLIVKGETSYETFVGFLFECYHYIKLFPTVIKEAYDLEENKELKNEFYEFYKQELNHEEYVLSSLMKLGYKKHEVENSIPLVSTKNIIDHMKNLVKIHPFSLFFINKIIESDSDEKEINDKLKDIISNKFSINRDVLNTFFEHSSIDYKLSHYSLLEKNIAHFYLNENTISHDILNYLHDIKHCFDLQKLEILEYYNKIGNYIPRQKVDFFGV